MDMENFTAEDYKLAEEILRNAAEKNVTTYSSMSEQFRDREYEDIEQGSFIDKFADINDKYNDVDVLILNNFEKMFSGLIAINVNGF